MGKARGLEREDRKILRALMGFVVLLGVFWEEGEITTVPFRNGTEEETTKGDKGEAS